MYKLNELIVCIIILIVLISLFGNNSSENFRVDSQNFPYTNANNVANLLDYSSNEAKGMYDCKNNNVMGPSSKIGVNQNSNVDIFDNRGFKFTQNSKSNGDIDVFTNIVDNQQLKNNFERTYLLDPNGSVAKYDITNNKISPNCCPAQYAPPFKMSSEDDANSDYSQKYVANQYSGMNYQDGYGCVCMTPDQAEFYGSRGGNTE
jgi:hypothetical protein